ncbi:uncharacterized protein G2W53_011544 [Senna tora]|uniref:Uncharacterized protein n=1 Tax=Senna tora TaxID=362788 RepID=A0A835CDD3_9FABA|nr:uncharacterized protein G2W53_011544 [Senna tora]
MMWIVEEEATAFEKAKTEKRDMEI